MVEKFGFCSRSLASIPELIDHYATSHNTTKDNSPVIESYLDVLTAPPSEFFIQVCECCGKTFFDGKQKAKHYLSKHLRLNVNNNNLLMRRICNRFIEFSIDYERFKYPYDFFTPDKIITSFIEAVARKSPGEFRTIFSIMNQSAAQVEGKRIYSKTYWSSGLIQGKIIDERVKEFLYLNTKKGVLINGENGSNVYFYRFEFLKVHFITSFLVNRLFKIK